MATMKQMVKRRLRQIGLLPGARGPAPAPQRGMFLIAPAAQRTIDVAGAIAAAAQGPFGTSGPDEFSVISYGTRDGVYDSYLDRLRDSCERAGLAFAGETIPACGRANACLFKPSFIKFKLLTLGRTVVWLDSDAVLNQAFSLPEGDWDLATVGNTRLQGAQSNEKLALCIAFRPTVAALRFVELWESFCAAPWLSEGLDHQRFSWCRHLQGGQYVEADMTPHLRGKLVRDAGRQKEATV